MLAKYLACPSTVAAKVDFHRCNMCRSTDLDNIYAHPLPWLPIMDVETRKVRSLLNTQGLVWQMTTDTMDSAPLLQPQGPCSCCCPSVQYSFGAGYAWQTIEL